MLEQFAHLDSSTGDLLVDSEAQEKTIRQNHVRVVVLLLRFSCVIDVSCCHFKKHNTVVNMMFIMFLCKDSLVLNILNDEDDINNSVLTK